MLVLRPEDIRISSTAPAEGNGVTGIITRVNFLGANVNVGVRVGHNVVSVVVPRHLQLPPEGVGAFLSWPERAGILYAAS